MYFIYITHPLIAQVDPDDFSDILEQVIQDLELEGDFDYDATYERLAGYLDRPADLNNDDLEDFVSMGLLTDGHIFALRSHIQSVGRLISIYELQSVPGFNADLIRRIRPFVTVGGNLWDLRQPLKSIVLQGDNQIAMRWSRTVQEQRGYTVDDEGLPRYLGDPNRVYLRYRHRNENRVSYGITMEKDPGEEFFSGSNKQGFDFYSAHFFLNNYRQWIPRLAIGDYNISLGQGLIMHSGYGVGKSAFVTQIKKGGHAVRPFASVNEFDFLRGAAVTVSPGPNTQLTLFASSRKRDANVQIDSIEMDGVILPDYSFSSLQLSGLHRTESEIADEKQISHRIVGTSLQYRGQNIRGSLNAVYNHLSSSFQRSEELYNAYRFQGTSLLNVSADYAYLYRNFHFFGETAMSDNGALATINGLLVGVHRRADIAILGRWLPRNYHSLGATPFAETSSGDNEHGIYFGLELRPTVQWTLSAYADIWRHLWLRFNVDAPSTGQEQLVRLTYRKKRTFEFYAQYRHEQKEKNLTGNDEPFDPLVEQRKHQMRVHFSYKVTPALELRSRVEGVLYQEHTLPQEKGFVLYQDVLFKPVGSAFSFTTRVALFDTDSFSSAIYAYENDLVNQFYIPAYAYRGVRYYINLRYRGIRKLSLELRMAQTRYTDRDEIGSGNDMIVGNKKTDVKVQVMWEF
jgi:hypothetical protein